MKLSCWWIFYGKFGGTIVADAGWVTEVYILCFGPDDEILYGFRWVPEVYILRELRYRRAISSK